VRYTSTKSATFRREASALIVGEQGAAPLYLRLEDTVLLHQILDDLLLALFYVGARRLALYEQIAHRLAA
jgi:hypothetical protein